jgi:quercetin dioxygenase-like cupin family protein
VKKLTLILLLFVASTTAFAQDALQPLIRKDLAGFPGKEGLMVTVTFAPGHTDPIHRHNAYVFVYMLEGSVVMQLKGKPAVTLKPGDTFCETPTDVHLEGKNASSTEPAKFIAFFVKDKDAPILTPVK